MFRLILRTWSSKKNGFARTKIILGIGVFIIVAVILSFFPKMISNKVELDSVTERESLTPEADKVMSQVSTAETDEAADLFDTEVLRGNDSYYISSGERLSMSQSEMDKFRVRPKFSDGYQATGDEIWWQRDDSLLIKLGLQNKDIIKSVNGTKIQNIGNLVEAIYWGVSKPRIDIEIERNDKPLVVTYIVE
jgi:membrane-associated protease RseP (regulator of RpoE activity)